MTERKTSRLAALEQRVERLTSVLIIQSVLLGAVVLMWALRTAPFLALGVILAVPVLVFYRHSLPQWARSLIQWARQFRPAKQSASKRNKSTSAKQTSGAA